MVDTAQQGRPGRQRSHAVDEAILAATLDGLAADGYGGLTMSAVIAAAGVSSATLYRRWPTKQQLVAAALASLHPAITDIDTGSLDGDIGEFVRSVADTMSAVREKFVVPRLVVLGRVLDRARQRGELGPGLTSEAAMSFINGPLHHRAYVMGHPPTPTFVRGVVVAALASLRALAPVRADS